MPGSRRGQRQRRRKCLPDWGSGSAGRARRRSGRCCHGWIRSIWTGVWAPTSPRWPPPRRAAGGGVGRQDTARGATRRRGRRAPGGGVRPPRPAGARPARRRGEEQRNPLRAQASQASAAAGAAAGHRGCDAHPDRDRQADLLDSEVALPDDREGEPASLLARITALPWAEVPVTATDDSRGHGRVETRTLQTLTAARGIGFPYARQVGPDHPRTAGHRTGATHRRGRLRHLQPAVRAGPTRHDRALAAPALGHREFGRTGCATSPSTRTDPPPAPAQRHRSWPPCATPPSTCTASPEPTTSPKPAASPPSAPTAASTPHRPSKHQVTSVLVNNAGALPRSRAAALV